MSARKHSSFQRIPDRQSSGHGTPCPYRTTPTGTALKGEYLRAIINGGQTIEHREVKPYWDAKLAKYETSFWMRLINGMRAEAPEVTIEVVKVRKDSRPFDGHPKGVYCLHLGKIKSNSKKNLRNLIK